MPDVKTEAAQIGHNSAAVGEMIDADPAVIFRDPETLQAFLADLEATVEAFEPDLSTAAGRDAVASLAYGISRKKTKLDDAGKALNEDARKSITKVDVVRRNLRDRLDVLRDKARAPLNEWEAKEDARARAVAAFFREMDEIHKLNFSAGADALAGAIERIDNLKVDPAIFLDRTEEGAALLVNVRDGLQAALEAAVRAEEDRKELARLKAAEEARRAEEAEVARKAAAKVEADKKAAAAEAKAKADKKAAADAAALKAREVERKAAQKRIDAAEAERKAAADALAAREEEDRKAKAKAKAEADADAARAADNKHRDKVIGSAVSALVAQTGLTNELARVAVLAIAAGQVPAVTITF